MNKVHLLLPFEPIDFVSSPREKGCPLCGESRATDNIYRGKLTYLCGYSKLFEETGWEITPCQGTYFLSFICKFKWMLNSEYKWIMEYE